MSSDLIRADFYGRPVALHIIEGGEWVTPDVIAPLLELADRRKVANLFGRHKADFLEGVEYRYADICVPGSRTQTRKVLAFSLDGVEHLALLTRSRAGTKLRRWCIDTRRALRKGEAAIVTTAQVDALRGEVERLSARLIEAQADHTKNLQRVAETLMATNDKMASALGAALAHRKHQKAHQRALQAELDIGQRFFPGIDSRRDGGSIGPVAGRN